MLELKDLHVYIGQTYVLKGVSLYVDRGEIVALIGNNGAGKTTTLLTISGILHPRTGQILFSPVSGQPSEDITGRTAVEIVSMGISQCPEGRQIFSELSVKENLLIGGYQRRDRETMARDLDMVFELFPRLAERTRQSGGSLSGGEQMMLAIGRALMAHPRLLLLDEPSLGLAPLLVERLFEMLERINRQGTTILLVEQNASMALELAARCYVLETGRIVLAGTGAELSRNTEVQKAYLGIS
jgi:branched-chain amino acid transport system ATP-binding protein